MSNKSSERRLIENEVIFRELNEKLQKGIEEVNNLAEETQQPEYKIDTSSKADPFSFFCECADENCAERISMKLHTYKKIHRHRNKFIIKPGHEVVSIEQIVDDSERGFHIVKKYKTPPPTADRLNPTPVVNV